MVGWNPSYNWSYEEYRNVVDKAFINDDTVTLDTEHSDHLNEQQIVAWAEKDGYKAEILDSGERIRISKKKGH